MEENARSSNAVFELCKNDIDLIVLAFLTVLTGPIMCL